MGHDLRPVNVIAPMPDIEIIGLFVPMEDHPGEHRDTRTIQNIYYYFILLQSKLMVLII